MTAKEELEYRKIRNWSWGLSAIWAIFALFAFHFWGSFVVIISIVSIVLAHSIYKLLKFDGTWDFYYSKKSKGGKA